MMNADSRTMKYYPGLLSESESHALAQKFAALIAKRGWGFWAVELKKQNRFMGFVGLHKPEVKLPFTPCVEIGWRLSFKDWDNGYATEAATASLKFAFETLQINEVVSFTSLGSTRSQKVMQRLHRKNTDRDFKHPNIPKGHDLQLHVLYTITNAQWNHA